MCRIMKIVVALIFVLISGCAIAPEKSKCDFSDESDDRNPDLIDIIVEETQTAVCKKRKSEALERIERNKEPF